MLGQGHWPFFTTLEAITTIVHGKSSIFPCFFRTSLLSANFGLICPANTKRSAHHLCRSRPQRWPLCVQWVTIFTLRSVWICSQKFPFSFFKHYITEVCLWMTIIIVRYGYLGNYKCIQRVVFRSFSDVTVSQKLDSLTISLIKKYRIFSSIKHW